MTTPTQAQIEAAAKAISSAMEEPESDYISLAVAALTAAAQVGRNPPPSSINMWDDMERPLDQITIERCAQWIADGNGNGLPAPMAAEEMRRALKDKPCQS